MGLAPGVRRLPDRSRSHPQCHRRRDGPLRSYYYGGCVLDAVRERLYFGQSLGATDATGLREHTPVDTTELDHVRAVLMHAEYASNTGASIPFDAQLPPFAARRRTLL